MSTPRRNFKESLAWLERADSVVPGASQTFSKRRSMFPEDAPLFLERGDGCRVWDVDDNEYVDYILGLASITLGYNYHAVTEAVARQAAQGTIFSLPHRLEVEVSERLTEIIPCAKRGMVRFLKTGSEANAAAIRVARAATGRDIVVYCGYHGWHDWYAITTLGSKGIPKDFARFTVQFNYNELASLERALDENYGKVAAVIMEPAHFDAPVPGFLERVKTLAHRHGALLIFDEIVTGFRWALGGAQQYFDVVPDLATFGKGMANGLPLAAVVGGSDFMRELEKEDVFVSGTFGGDTLALAAVRATLDEYRDRSVIDHLWRVGRRFQQGFRAAAARVGVTARCVGYPVRPKVEILHENDEKQWELITLFLQETTQRGFLLHFAGLNVSFSHTEEDVDQTVAACEEALHVVGRALADGEIKKYLRGKPIRPFRLRS